jgi:hypothetical protein
MLKDKNTKNNSVFLKSGFNSANRTRFENLSFEVCTTFCFPVLKVTDCNSKIKINLKKRILSNQ